MKSDTKIKLGIITYAKAHGIYEEKLFNPLFEHCATVSFKIGEPIKIPSENLLCLIYSGAVLGKLKMGDGHEQQHLLTSDQLFYTGSKLPGLRNRKESSWMAILPTELTFIRFSLIEDIAQYIPEYWERLIQHIISSDESQSQLYHSIHGHSSLVDKLNELLKHREKLLEIKQVYLASYLLVLPASFSRALKKWEKMYLF